MKTCSTINGYQIRIADHLDPHWAAWFEDWTITNLNDGEVLLTCTQVDQSRLHGALNRIRDLNLKLISVEQIPAKQDLDSIDKQHPRKAAWRKK